jgi:hypothetical protein
MKWNEANRLKLLAAEITNLQRQLGIMWEKNTNRVNRC